MSLVGCYQPFFVLVAMVKYTFIMIISLYKAAQQPVRRRQS